MVSIITALVGYRTPPAFQRSGNRRIVIVRRTQHSSTHGSYRGARVVPPVVIPYNPYFITINLGGNAGRVDC